MTDEERENLEIEILNLRVDLIDTKADLIQVILEDKLG